MIQHLLRFIFLGVILTGANVAKADITQYSEPGNAKAPVKNTYSSYENGSEFLYQTPAGKIDLKPGLGVDIQSIRYVANDQKQLNKLGLFSFAGEYGINRMFTIGLDLGYTAGTGSFTCQTAPCSAARDIRGLTDPKIIFKGRNGLSLGTIRYGVDFSVALEKHKVNDSAANENVASGGTTVTPWAGYELPVGPGLLGAKLFFDLFKGERKIQDDSISASETTTAGSKIGLSAFYEAMFDRFTYGAALTLTQRQESRTSMNGGPSSPNRDEGSDIDFNIYVPMQFTDRTALIPSLHVVSGRYPHSGTIDGTSDLIIDCAGRFTF